MSCVCMFLYVCVSMYGCTFVCMCACVCVHVCMYGFHLQMHMCGLMVTDPDSIALVWTASKICRNSIQNMSQPHGHSSGHGHGHGHGHGQGYKAIM